MQYLAGLNGELNVQLKAYFYRLCRRYNGCLVEIIGCVWLNAIKMLTIRCHLHIGRDD